MFGSFPGAHTLATVQAIALQTLRNASPDERAVFVARLQMLASAHDLVTLESWDRAPMGDLVTRALAPFQESHHERIFTDGPRDIRLDANKSVLLAHVGLHELATNAVKYGALSKGSGQVSVTWKRLPETFANRGEIALPRRRRPGSHAT